jgi:hypothetical protein
MVGGQYYNLVDIDSKYDDDSPWKDISTSSSILQFLPAFEFQHLRVRENHSFNSNLKVIIDSKMLLILTQTHDNWRFIRLLDSKITGWIFVSDKMLNDKVIIDRYALKLYETWTGMNLFFCSGKIITGPDILTFRSILLFNLTQLKAVIT